MFLHRRFADITPRIGYLQACYIILSRVYMFEKFSHIKKLI